MVIPGFIKRKCPQCNKKQEFNMKRYAPKETTNSEDILIYGCMKCPYETRMNMKMLEEIN